MAVEYERAGGAVGHALNEDVAQRIEAVEDPSERGVDVRPPAASSVAFRAHRSRRPRPGSLPVVRHGVARPNDLTGGLTYNHMVVELSDHELVDGVFRALADATRRDIVVHVLQGEWSVSALARNYPMSFAAVQKHVAVLERASLITKQRHGREQLVRANIDTVRRAAQLLDQFETLWRDRIDRMAEILTEPNQGAATV